MVKCVSLSSAHLPPDQHWKTDCISDVAYDVQAKSVSFNMDAFYAFTLMQDMYANMPFQDWELRPLGPNSAMLTITGALMEVKITVKVGPHTVHSQHRTIMYISYYFEFKICVFFFVKFQM